MINKQELSENMQEIRNFYDDLVDGVFDSKRIQIKNKSILIDGNGVATINKETII